MNTSHRLLDELIGRRGLTQLTVAELCVGGSLVDMVTEKVNTLDSFHFSERQVEKQIRLFIEVLRETFARRYNGLSLLAFAHILVTLDHFIRVNDPKPDTEIGGYEDDLAAINKVLKEFHTEFEQFKAWQQRMKIAECP
jgi:hypothetical protein